MRFWKLFAWIALGWALVMRRGAVLIKKTSPKTAEGEPDSVASDEQQSGPNWRRASPTSSRYPGRKGRRPSEHPDDGTCKKKSPDREADES